MDRKILFDDVETSAEESQPFTVAIFDFAKSKGGEREN
jgi:hypothetical protein